MSISFRCPLRHFKAPHVSWHSVLLIPHVVQHGVLQLIGAVHWWLYLEIVGYGCHYGRQACPS